LSNEDQPVNTVPEAKKIKVEKDISIPLGRSGETCLIGDLARPEGARSVILFVHGSGSSRKSPRHDDVSEALNRGGFTTLRVDLLTTAEQDQDQHERYNIITGRPRNSTTPVRQGVKNLRHDIELHVDRLLAVTDWLAWDKRTAGCLIGYFGASTGAGVAVRAAAHLESKHRIGALVSRGGRLDLVEPLVLGLIKSRPLPPTLLIVGKEDGTVVELNREIERQLQAEEKKVIVIPGATHLFEERGALAEVARLTVNWFKRYLAPG
jgi:putative phosphoribosyl transferase